MDEYKATRVLANRILDRPSGDPDDELAMLSRQLLRADEREKGCANLLTNIAQILDVVKEEWTESWGEWDQEQRDAITKYLTWWHARL